MIVSLIGKDRICKVKLPEKVEGNYWLEYNKEKLINIEANGNKSMMII